MALTSFFTALTGLNTNSHTINVIGDNLANMNTIGFKAGKATFAEIIGGMSGFSATGNPIVFGQGSNLNGIVHKQVQGTPEYTGNETDAMINGNGYFVVSTGDGGGIGYTRSGRFQFDGTGNLITSDGYNLMGYMADENGMIDLSGTISPIEIRKGQFIPATATTEISAAVNLDSQTSNAAPFNTFATSIEIFDSLGNQHEVRLTFTKTSAPGALPTWNLEAATKDSGGTNINILPATALTFDASGRLTAPTTLSMTIPAGTFGAGIPAGAQTLALGLFDDRNNPLITSAASESATSHTTQNGYASSTLERVMFDNVGHVIGIAENGKSIILAQLALATFPNTEGMLKYNGSTFIASMNAGEPSIGTAGSGGRGVVQGGSLEMSNVDMAEEFVNLVIAQRAFQANARMITTSDELYMEAVNLKR